MSPPLQRSRSPCKIIKTSESVSTAWTADTVNTVRSCKQLEEESMSKPVLSNTLQSRASCNYSSHCSSLVVLNTLHHLLMLQLLWQITVLDNKVGMLKYCIKFEDFIILWKRSTFHVFSLKTNTKRDSQRRQWVPADPKVLLHNA